MYVGYPQFSTNCTPLLRNAALLQRHPRFISSHQLQRDAQFKTAELTMDLQVTSQGQEMEVLMVI
jgi:hypothetical protein